MNKPKIKHDDYCVIPTGVLSVVIPVYNEQATVSRLLSAVLMEEVVGEVIIIDDGSTDQTVKILGEIAMKDKRMRVIAQQQNKGKGAAVREGLRNVTLDIALIQDADLEYDPKEYNRLIGPILHNKADVVFGTRFSGGEHRVLYYWHSVGNWWLTTLSNMCSGLNLTDMECCYKLFHRRVFQHLQIAENGFGVEPELVSRIAALNARAYEVPISYHGRTYAEGKKIRWWDGLWALWCILKYSFFFRPHARSLPTFTREVIDLQQNDLNLTTDQLPEKIRLG